MAEKSLHSPCSLGVRGFATIYTVWDLAAQTEQVLKVLVEPSPKARELFEQEAAVLANLRHPGVPRVEPDGYFQLSLGYKARSLPCLVMEKINGQTLQEILDQHPQGCPETWIINWLNQAIEILRELHRHQIIHRDLKPSNLMLRDKTRQLVVIDFGGAKQIGPAPSQTSSTRLFSSGYSPPEQIAGRVVAPNADFYALGRTMIQLLTGRYPPDLEDPVTGLRWRDVASVSPAVADLLDDLVQEDVRKRPTTATAIQERITRISQRFKQQVSFFKLINQLVRNGWNYFRAILTASNKYFSQLTLFLFKIIIQLVRACLDTIWGMVLSALGACVGTLTGFILAYWSPVGGKVAGFLSQQLLYLVPDTRISVGPEILLFATAGLGTAWGLTVAGGFGQRRRYLVATPMGILAYGLGWLVWQVFPHKGVEALMGLITVAVALLTLGLGLPSHHLVHTVVASVGSATVFAGLATFSLYPPAVGYLFSDSTPHGWSRLWAGIAFFDTLGITLGFWLGVSYYALVPLLRCLGWR